jgi:Mg-chelatase subunit ChlD
MLLVILFALVAGSINAYLLPRGSSTKTCTNLYAQSNNGDRKIAIVIDSSGSMAESDPSDLRLQAGRSVIDWLISKSGATSSHKQDLVTVINFDDAAYVDYPLGDPGNAASSLNGIGADGRTYIAGGVEMGIQQLTTAGSGNTADRSGMVVFTDGEVRDSAALFYMVLVT